MKKMLLFTVIALVFAPVLIFSQNCGCQNCVTFETLGVGSRYGDPTQVPGDVIMMECDILVSLEKFVWTSGGTTFNFCETQNAVGPLGPTPVMGVNNIKLNFDFTQMGFTAQYVTFEFIDYGGGMKIFRSMASLSFPESSQPHLQTSLPESS